MLCLLFNCMFSRPDLFCWNHLRSVCTRVVSDLHFTLARPFFHPWSRSRSGRADCCLAISTFRHDESVEEKGSGNDATYCHMLRFQCSPAGQRWPPKVWKEQFNNWKYSDSSVFQSAAKLTHQHLISISTHFVYAEQSNESQKPSCHPNYL